MPILGATLPLALGRPWGLRVVGSTQRDGRASCGSQSPPALGPFDTLPHSVGASHIRDMIKLLPILLAVGYGLLMWWLSTRRLHRELDERSTLLADGPLKRLTERMAEALEVERIPVHVYEIEPVNGLAAPDGRIFITRGFYDRYRRGEVTAEELASVIAHELGHVALGHSRRRLIDFSGQNALRTTLALILGRFLPGIGALIAQGVVSLVAARLSRSDEYEADAYASALLLKAGIGTGPQKSLFGKLDALTKGRGGATPAWLLSHPRTAERVAAIEALEARWAVAAT